MEGWRIVGYMIPLVTAALLMVALWIGSVPFALGVLALAIAASMAYSEWLKMQGEVFSDERTLRIDETASRRTLQVIILVLAFSVVSLAVLSQSHPGLRSAYYLSLALMVLVSVLKVALRHHYSRVM